MSDRQPGTLGTLFRPPPAGFLPLALLVILWLVAINHYPHLPDDLPSRFEPWGVPVDWAPKNPAYFVLPATATLIYLTLGMVAFAGAREPIVDGKALRGKGAQVVGRMIRRYLFFMRTALMAWLLNLQFRLTQVAYGNLESLGWDSYLVAGLMAVYMIAGAVMLLRSSRRWLAKQEAATGCSPPASP